MTAAFRAWKSTLAQAVELEAKLTNIEDRAALLRYQLDELQDLSLADGEFETLDVEFKRASKADSIQEIASQAIDALSELDIVRQHQRDLARIDDDHGRLNAAREALSSASELTDDAVHELRNYVETLDMDPSRLAELEERLNLVHDLARKHRVPSEGLSAHHRALRAELGTLNADQGELETLQQAATEHRKTFEVLAAEVTRQRRHAADGFASEVSACIDTLGITGGSLSVEFNPADSERGLEAVEFQIVTNPKYPAGSLRKVASGGERARISLAIQVVAAEKTRLPCLVLDEADVGVGGTAADIIGRMLRSLGAHTQVICVTHAPQVAALGDAHFCVEKDSEQDTQIHALNSAGRIEELARMLAGADVTDKTRSYARTLLDEATARTLH
jgi:DNA repair protein RecN (Recombination protein N)